MAIYRQRYKDGATGETHQTKDYYIRFRDYRGPSEVRIRCFQNRHATEQFERRLKQLIDCRTSGIDPDLDLQRWIKGLSEYHIGWLLKLDLITKAEVAKGRAVQEHLEDYLRHLRDKGVSEHHARQTYQRCKRVIGDAAFRSLLDISARAVESCLGQLRNGGGGISSGTSNRYASSMKGFCNWLVREKLLEVSPLAHIQAHNEDVTKRHPRRALLADEVTRLLQVTREGEPVQGLTGPERELLYILSMETGLRWSELHSLRRDSFDLEVQPPTVTVDAGHSKRRRKDVLPLRPETAQRLCEHLTPKAMDAPAFPMWRRRGARMLRHDLERAGIPYQTKEGFVDFHALRHTFVSMLARSGVHPKVAQTLARHSDLSLTMNHYTHTELDLQVEALASLPRLGG